MVEDQQQLSQRKEQPTSGDRALSCVVADEAVDDALQLRAILVDRLVGNRGCVALLRTLAMEFDMMHDGFDRLTIVAGAARHRSIWSVFADVADDAFDGSAIEGKLRRFGKNRDPRQELEHRPVARRPQREKLIQSVTSRDRAPNHEKGRADEVRTSGEGELCDTKLVARTVRTWKKDRRHGADFAWFSFGNN